MSIPHFIYSLPHSADSTTTEARATDIDNISRRKAP